MEYITAEGGTIVRLYQGEAERVSAKAKAAIAQLARCSQCESPLDPKTLLCRGNPESSEPHDGFFVSAADWEKFEDAVSFEKRREKDKKRAQRRADAMRDVPGFYTKADIVAIRDAQHHECYYCGTPLTRAEERRDHMTPVAAGGSEWPSNIALTCHACNHAKSDRGAIAFWNVLRKSRGGAWVTNRQTACKNVDALTSTLTKQRKTELDELCTALYHKLNEGVRELGLAGKLLKAENVYITVEHSKAGIDIQLENTALSFPASAHRRVARWVATQWPQILNALLELESTMGTLALSGAKATAKKP